MTRIVFFGTPHFASAILKTLLTNSSVDVAAVVTQPDKASGRGNKISYSPVKEIALEHKIKVLQPANIRKNIGDFVTALHALGPFDIGIVVAFGQILPKEILDLPRCGCLNIHASILPRWRGAAPIQRAIISGDTETGICLMKMEEGLDTGPVYKSARVPILEHDTFESIHNLLSEKGGQLLNQEIDNIVKGSVSAVDQSTEGVTYAQKITNEEAHIDWTKSSKEVHDQIRGLSPFPGAFCMAEGMRIKVFLSEVVSLIADGPPGHISRASKHELRVSCGRGEVRLVELQLEGRRRLPAEEYLNGTFFKEGMVLQ